MLLQDDKKRMGYDTGEGVDLRAAQQEHFKKAFGLTPKEIAILDNPENKEYRKVIRKMEKQTDIDALQLELEKYRSAKKEEPRVQKAHGGGDLPNKGLESLHKEEPELVGRMIAQEGGSMDDQMLMVMTPPMESEMEPDGEMEDGYTRFIMEEALSEDEEDMLMSKLEQDEELAMLFDKVIDVAQEFAGSGPVEGPGSGVSDSIPARLSDGEFVFTAKAVEEIGEDTLMSMMKEAEAAADERQGLAEGGIPEDNNVNVQAEALLGMDMAPNPTQEAINENMIKYQPYVRS